MVDGQGEFPFSDRAAAVDGLDEFRNDVLAELPALLERALAGYGRFATGTPPSDTKGFVAYQAACRAALSQARRVQPCFWRERCLQRRAFPARSRPA